MKTKIRLTKNMGYLLVSIIFILILSSCADVISVEECVGKTTIYGFWRGLLHGVISPFTFIISLFTDDVAIYAINNNGNWYNFGFMFGVAIIFGSGGNASKKRRK